MSRLTTAQLDSRSSHAERGRWIVTLVAAAAALFVTQLTQARAPDATTTKVYQSKPVLSSVTKTDVLSRDGCWKIDKTTGQLIACDPPSSSGGRVGDTGSGGGYVSSDPLPFDFFVHDHSEVDFDADHASVVPNAYLLSQLAAISYRNPGTGSDAEGEQAYALAEGMGLEWTPVIRETKVGLWETGAPEGDSLAYVFYNDDALFVVFQGSKGGTDWLESNIDFVPRQMPEWGEDSDTVCFYKCVKIVTSVVTVHFGFYDAMDLIFDQVLERIESKLEGRKLWIVGHSLGGAVAKLTAFRLKHEHGIEAQGVHVFGAPAVGDGHFAEVFDAALKNVHRWNVEGDPAPVITQWPMFYHVGIVNNLMTDGSVDFDSDHMLGYVAHCAPLYGIVVSHMIYWPRMHEVLEDYYPALVDWFPEPMPAPTGPCLGGGWAP